MTKNSGRVFLDSELTPGTTYYYVVTAEDTAPVRNQSAASATVSAVPNPAPDTTAPNAVTGFTAAVTDNQVVLGWSASTASDLNGYNVYRSATAGGTRVKLTAFR